MYNTTNSVHYSVSLEHKNDGVVGREFIFWFKGIEESQGRAWCKQTFEDA